MIQIADRLQHVEEYYFSKKLAEVKSIDIPEFPVINLGIGSPDLAPSNEVINAMVNTAQQNTSHGYQSYKGTQFLRDSIRDFYHSIYHVTLNSETEILPLMGSKEGIMHITVAFTNHGDEILIPDPGYPTYSSVAKLMEITARTYPINSGQGTSMDIESLSRQDLSRVKILWANFPHMPTGKVATEDELKALVELAHKHNFLIVNDNPYSLIMNDAPLSILSIDGANEVALELNSLSKSHNMAGWRVGWVAGRKEYIDAVLKVKSNMDSGMFLGLQHAASVALNKDANWFSQLNNIYKRRKVKALEILDTLGCSYSPNQAGLFIWAKAPDEIKDITLWIDQILHSTHVFITPGFIFGEGGKRYIRISLCAKEEMLEEALHRIKKYQNNQENHALNIKK